MRCPSCQVECSPGTRFCRRCGTVLEQTLACPACGAPAAGADVRFCRACGTPLPAGPGQLPAVAPPQVAPPPPETPAGKAAGSVRVTRRPGAKAGGPRKTAGGKPGGPPPAAAGPPQAPPSPKAPPSAGAPPQAPPAAPVQAGPAAEAAGAGRPCPACGQVAPSDARFCKGCGAPLAPEDQPIAVSQVVRAVVQGAAAVAGAGAAVQRAGSTAAFVGEVLKDPRSLVADPQRLLKPVAARGASAKLNLLEILAMVAVVLLVGGFYLFGLLKFGFVAMLTSGTPFFCAYALGLTFGLAALRNVLDRPLGPLLRLLQKVPPKVRLALGFALPLLWVIVDSKDLGSGFQHAMFTVTMATGLGHVLFRSLRGAP